MMCRIVTFCRVWLIFSEFLGISEKKIRDMIPRITIFAILIFIVLRNLTLSLFYFWTIQVSIYVSQQWLYIFLNCIEKILYYINTTIITSLQLLLFRFNSNSYDHLQRILSWPIDIFLVFCIDRFEPSSHYISYWKLFWQIG